MRTPVTEINPLNNAKSFLITAFLAILAFNLPLILNNYYFRDDYVRAHSATTGWSDLGRPLGDVITRLVTADWQLMTETSPLFLVLSLLITVFSCCKALQLRNIPFNFLTASLLVTLLFNPLYIECLLYRFDCLIMASSFGCAVLAWGYYRKSTKLTFLFCFLTLNFYQTFLNLFIALIIIEVLFNIYNGDSLKENIKYLLKSLLYPAFAMILYYVITRMIISEYAGGKGTIVFFSEKGIIFHYSKILENAYSRYFGFLSPTGKIFYILAFIISFIEIQLHFYKHTRYTFSVLRATICSLALLFFLPLSLGFLFAISGDGPIAPRMIVAGILFSVMIVFLCFAFLSRLAKRFTLLGKKVYQVPIILWGFLFFFLTPPLAFSYIVNNMIRLQNEYDLYRVNKLVDTLEEFSTDQQVIIFGDLSISPLLNSTSRRMRLSRHLVPRASDWVLASRLRQYGLNNVLYIDSQKFMSDYKVHFCDHPRSPFIKKRDFSLYQLDHELFAWIGRKDICTMPERDNDHDQE